MHYQRYNGRVRKLESVSSADARLVALWLEQGRYYDDLDDDEQDIYARYKCVDRQAMEDVEMIVCGTLHFPLEMNRKPQPIEEVQAEISEFMARVWDEYNTTEGINDD